MKRSIRDLVNLKGKRVLLRADFNVPLDSVGRIVDKTKIIAEIPTIKYLVERGAKVIVCSHLGSPKGYDISLSLWPISLILLKYFPGKVQFSHKIVGDEVKEHVASMSNGSVLLLENTRFNEGEKANDPEFARQLASLADIYVNDAFGSCHRKHASTYGAARLLPNAVGFLVETELKVLNQTINDSRRPFVAIFGGKKVEDKINVLSNILTKADTLLIGGAMAYPFLAANWETVGKSPASTECISIANEILARAKELNKKIILPVDHIAVYYDDIKQKPFITTKLEDDMIACDIGPKTVELFARYIRSAGQVVWNGPLGKYEDPKFRSGTFKIADILSRSSCYSVVGGGDSVSAINKAHKEKMINHLSTGGGATITLLEGNSLPCIDVIQEKVL